MNNKKKVMPSLARFDQKERREKKGAYTLLESLPCPAPKVSKFVNKLKQ